MKLHKNLLGGKHADKCGQTPDKLSCIYKLYLSTRLSFGVY